VVQGGYNMAHFAELNGSNVVQRVLVFSNVEIVRNGGDWSSEAETHINSKMGGTWKQCSYNFTQRGRFPSVGWTWNPSLNKFQEPKPFNSWTWNNSDNEYQAPVTTWDETGGRWVTIDNTGQHKEWVPASSSFSNISNPFPEEEEE
jgi:hypothetical protein